MLISWVLNGFYLTFIIFIFDQLITRSILTVYGVYYDPNDMGKANVKVSEVLKQSGRYDQIHKKPNAWSPPDGDRYTHVHMRILGKEIDQTVLNNLRPKMNNRNIRRLTRLLGDKRDTAWTSIERPKNLKEKGDNFQEMIESKLVVAADALNLTFNDGTGSQFVLPDHVLRMFRNWLLRTATCTMDYIWEDLGPLFWPQWIRRGICVNSVARSCSWPPGMKCRASGSRALHILYWSCKIDTDLREYKERQRRESVRRRRNRRDKQQEIWNRRSRRRINRRGSYRNRRLISDNSPAARRRRQAKRIKRLIRRTSLVSNGYYCKWDIHTYLINDKCSCSCA